MSDHQLPDPLVPAEVDLRGLEYMPLLGARLFSSDFALNASDAEFRRGLQLWWAAWNQTPAASLPDSDRAQAKLAGFEDETSQNWRKVRKQALDGFIKCSDGRLYHPVLARQALIAWEKRGEVRAEKENAAERQSRTRAERKRMFNDLRERGITAKWDIPMADLRALHAQHVTASVTPPVTVTGNGTGHAPVTVTDTAKTGRDGTGRIEQARADPPPLVAQQAAQPAPDPADPRPEPPEPQLLRHGTPPPDGRTIDMPPPEPEPQQSIPVTVSPAGRACRAMREAGLQATNPGDPRLIALLAQGATIEEFAGIAAEAASKAKGFAWVLVTLQERRKQAAAISLAPPAAKPREPSGRQPEFKAPAPLTAEERAASDIARREAMARLGRTA